MAVAALPGQSSSRGRSRSTVPGPLGVIEVNGANVVAEAERRGRPRRLFLPWFAANVSVLGLSYGSFVLGFGISFWQATGAALVGIIVSFALCGVVALAGKRGSAPTMVLTRGAFGVRGAALPSFVSWVSCVGWETVLTALAAEATATVFTRLGWGGGTVTKLVAFLVVAALIVGGGVLGFDAIMKLQGVITAVTAILTVGFVALTVDKVHWSAVQHTHGGSTAEVVGAAVLVMTGFGLGWVNTAADYSRYLPRRSSGAGVVGWTTFGGAAAPVVLVVYGLALAGSSVQLSKAISADPIGALAAILPTWYLVPFVIVAVLGLVGGAVLDIYSSGLALVSLGLRIPRYAAAAVDGTVMVAGAIYVVFFSSSNFVVIFEGFLITLGVPIAAWCGVMLADIALRRRDYVDAALSDPSGRYGDVRVAAVALAVLATIVGWGTVVNSSAGWLSWQGYLLGPLGLGGTTGTWAGANLGVVVALVAAMVGWLVLGARTVGAQETDPASPQPVGAA